MSDQSKRKGITKPITIRRILAFAIDYIFVLLVLQIIATLAFSPTGGRVQSSGPFEIINCQWPPAQEITFPHGDLSISTAGRHIQQSVCTLGLPGIPHARILKVTASQKSGTWTINQTDRVALDSQNRAVWILWLGVFAVPLLGLYRLFTEKHSGQTIGKKWLGIRVTSKQEGSLTTRQAIARNLWLLLPFFAADLVMEGPMLAAPNLILLTPTFGWLTLAVTLLCSIWYSMTIIEIARGNDPIHDKRAGTGVERTK
jgi:uncharacterized RDD family membrane protein YckC